MNQARTFIGILALVLSLVAVIQLEQSRAGLQISDLSVGTTPVTLYQRASLQQGEQPGPIVVVAHGFAGSRQIMQSYSLALAQAGYRVLAFDFEGHGRNSQPMSGDVTSVEGTTALLVAETRRVIAYARSLPGDARVGLLGHSMATDIIVRASIAETTAGHPVQAVVAISMFSQAVTADAPQQLLVISGAWESYLREAGLDAVHLVDPNAIEGALAHSGIVRRATMVAPGVEHVGVLFSPSAVKAAQDWFDVAFAHQSKTTPTPRGWWILALLGGIVLGFYPVVSKLPAAPATARISTGRFLLAILVPTVAAPLMITPFYRNFLPVLVADYLMLHLALFGLLQLALLRIWPRWPTKAAALSALMLVLWGTLVFGLALDRYAANFWPTLQRLPIIAALCLGTVPCMVADSYLTQAGRAALWRRSAARLALFASLGVAAVLDPGDLTFVLIVLPVFVLFFLVHGLMGRWIAQRSGALAAGLGLGLCLAWALGVSFPLFAPS
ncbi:alpha/beta fold hydrolase [Cypionkella sp.]|uniref:alpha/beta hydrolase n=1 Tax=Cypionkella sp. TaxID=2811411 RepID=UPI0026098E17|nr:alpha/beta fold hydrolase [Cypionkella sp.]MDB5665671.1 hydrolase, alpha/beta fold family [Cypionkella sp.]